MHLAKRYWFLFLCFSVCLMLLSVDMSVQAQERPATSRSFISGGLAWSPDGSRIAVGTNDGVWIHQTDDLDDVEHVIEANFVTTLDWHPTENWIATGSFSPEEDPLRVWDADTGETLHVLEGHEHVINNVRWSQDGELLASRSWDQTIRVWRSDSGQVVQIISIWTQITDGLMDLSPDSQQLATMDLVSPSEIHILVYDVHTGDITLSWHFDISTSGFAWSPDGSRIATMNGDNLLRLWNAESGELMDSIEVRGRSSAITWSPDSTKLVLHLADYTERSNTRLVMLDIESGEIVAESSTFKMGGYGFYANAIAYSPDGTQIASISDEGRLLLFSSTDLTLLSSYDDYRSLIDD